MTGIKLEKFEKSALIVLEKLECLNALLEKVQIEKIKLFAIPSTFWRMP